MKLNMIKHPFQHPVANSWADVCMILNRGEIPCINMTRIGIEDFLMPRVKLIDDRYGVDVQITSKSTDLLDFFEIDDILIEGVPIRECTNKDLRKAHNIRRMYIAGAFDYNEEGE